MAKVTFAVVTWARAPAVQIDKATSIETATETARDVMKPGLHTASIFGGCNFYSPVGNGFASVVCRSSHFPANSEYRFVRSVSIRLFALGGHPAAGALPETEDAKAR